MSSQLLSGFTHVQAVAHLLLPWFRVTPLVLSRFQQKSGLQMKFNFVIACLYQKGVELWLYSCINDELWQILWIFNEVQGLVESGHQTTNKLQIACLCQKGAELWLYSQIIETRLVYNEWYSWPVTEVFMPYWNYKGCNPKPVMVEWAKARHL